MAWIATGIEGADKAEIPEVSNYLKLFPQEWVSRHLARSFWIKGYRFPYPTTLENLRLPRSADLGDVCVCFVRSILLYQGLRQPAVDLAGPEDLPEIEGHPPQIEIPLVTDGWIPKTLGFSFVTKFGPETPASPTKVALVAHGVQIINHRTNLGTFAIFSTPHGAENQPGDETKSMDRLSAAAGLVGAVMGKLPICEELFSFEVDSQGAAVNAGTCDIENPAWFKVPNLSVPGLGLLESLALRLSTLTADLRERAELSLRWLDDAMKDRGIMAFLKYWIAIEALAMVDTTNIAPLKRRMAVAYECSEAQANTRFALGRLANLRGEIVHKGRTLQIGQDLLWLVEAIYVDILAQMLGCPSGRLAEAALKRSGRSAEELTSAASPVSPRRLRMSIKTAREAPP